MARQGRFLSEAEVQRIVCLLASTDMTHQQIARRMRCSPSVIGTINKKRQIRIYSGKRTDWSIGTNVGSR